MLKKDQCWRCDTICSAPTAKIYCTRCEMAFYCSDKCKGSDEFRHQVDCQTAALKRKCSGCGKEKTGLKPCGSCRQVWCCDKECQKKSWPTHKAHCQQVTKKTSELAHQMKSTFDVKELMNVHGEGIHLYYWGNTPAVDLINLPLNEGCDYSNVNLCLFSLVALETQGMLCFQWLSFQNLIKKTTFVLNDICACTLARTVLILYLLFKGKLPVINGNVMGPSMLCQQTDYLRDCQSGSNL